MNRIWSGDRCRGVMVHFLSTSWATMGLMLASTGPIVRAQPGNQRSAQTVAPSGSIKASGTGENSRVRTHRAPHPISPDAEIHDWPAFLGPEHNGVSRETKILATWPAEGLPLLWEMETGSGYAAPAVAGHRLVFFHRLGDEEVVECLDAETGKRHWQHRYRTDYKDRYDFSNGPRSSPVIDGNLVFTHGAAGHLLCLQLFTGNVVWELQTSQRFKVPQDFFGVGSTPLVDGNVLVVNVGAPGGPCVVGFEKGSGRILWRAGNQWGPSYASPVPMDVGGTRRVLVFAGGDSDPPTGGLLAIDPKSGGIGVRFPFRSSVYTSVNAATPVVAGSDVFLTTSYKTGCVLLRMLPEGGHEVIWKNDHLRAHFATPVLQDGYLYGFDEPSRKDTAIVCVEWKTGRQVWRAQPTWKEPVKRNGTRELQTSFLEAGALIAAGGRFICLSRDGHLLHLDLSPKGYKELSRVRLFHGSEGYTNPVISRGLLYITQNQRDPIGNTPPRLLCYDLRAAE